MKHSPWCARASLGAGLFGRTSRPVARLLGTLLLLGSLATLLTLGWRHHEWRQLHEDRFLQLQQTEVRLAKQPRPVAPAPVPMSAAEVAAHNQAVHHLNIPWLLLLDTFERHSSAEVGLTLLEPEGRKALVRVQAEARSIDTLLAYGDVLMRDRTVAGLKFMQHETNEQDSNLPARLGFDVRFAADAWEGSP